MKALVSRFSVLVGVVGALLAGCVTATKARVHTVAVAVTTSDGKAPSSEQVKRILAGLAPEMARVGLQFAPTAVEADFVVTVQFTADLEGKGGQVTVAGMEPTARFRGTSGVSESEDTKEVRRRLREMDVWAMREMTRTDQ